MLHPIEDRLRRQRPLVLAHARALLTNTTPEGITGYVHADLHDPDGIVADAGNS